MKLPPLRRRTLLRGLINGAAVALGLPLLERMLNSNGTALADGLPLPKRFVSAFSFCGVRLDRFEPAATGPGYPLSEELAPFANVQDYMTVCTGLQNKCETQLWGTQGMTAFNGYTFDYQGGLTAYAGGPTIDQVIADAIGNAAPLRAIHVGVSKRDSIFDSGTVAFAVSHASTAMPNYPEKNPQKVWDALFNLVPPPASDRALRTAVLDAVKSDLTSLKNNLGAADKQRLDAHVTLVEELQAKINALPPTCAYPPYPTETNADINGEEPIKAVSEAMADLVAYAFACDITRVASYMLTGPCAAQTLFTDIGQVKSNMGYVIAGDIENNHQATVYMLSRIAYLAERFKGTVDALGENLLDSSIIYWSSDCAEAVGHDIARQPIILLGHGRGSLIYPGIHYQAVPSPASAGNMSDVLLSCLRAFDPAAVSVGAGAPKSTTPLTEIM